MERFTSGYVCTRTARGSWVGAGTGAGLTPLAVAKEGRSILKCSCQELQKVVYVHMA